MKRILTLFLFIVFGVAAADAPVLSEHVKNKILKAQLEQAQIQTEANSLQARLQVLQANWTKAQADLDAAKKEAFKEAKIEEKDWTLDLGKLEFLAVPKPPEPKKP